MILGDVPSGRLDSYVSRVSRDLGLREFERPIVEVTSELGDGLAGDVKFNPDTGGFVVRLNPEVEWADIQNTIKHELGHIRSYRGQSDPYLSEKSEDYQKLKSVSRRELEASIAEDELSGRSINKTAIAEWMTQMVGDFGGNWKWLRSYLVGVAREYGIPPRIISGAVDMVMKYYR